MKLALERQIQLVFIIALLLLLILGYFAYRSASSMTEALSWEKHTQDVLLKLDDTLILATEAENGGRGFVVTGNEAYLEPFNQSEQKIGQNLTDLRLLVSDNPKQTAEIDRLENLTKQKIAFTQNLIETRRTQGLNAASSIIEDGQGKTLADETRLSIGRMKDEEQRLLKTREDDLDKSIGNTLFILFFGTTAGILSLGLANFAVYRTVKQRRTAEGETRTANLDLEKRVTERTHELSQRNDELKEQIKQREHAEQRRRIALEAGNLGTWTIDPKNNKADIDERSLRLFGLSDDDFDGSHEKVFSHIHAEDYPQIQDLFQKSLAERTHFNAKFRVALPDGSIRWNHCIGQPQFDENGELTHFAGHCSDITESKEYESVLLEKGIFSRAILDSLSAHIAVIDRNGNIVAVNEAWEHFAESNCVEEQIGSTGVGQNYLKVCEMPDAFEGNTKEIPENLKAVLNGDLASFAIEYPCYSPQEEHWFLMQVSAMRGADGGAVISHIDISGRKKAEQELKNSEQFNRSIFENSPDCVQVLELDGTFHSINANGLKLLEIDDYSEIIGKQWLDLWEENDSEQAYQVMQTALKGQTTHFEGFCTTATGKEKYWDVSISPIYDSEGKPSRLVATSRDITYRREAEREREKLLKNEQAARKDAEIANRMRDEFLATVSHE
ncbi:MAG: PAS domain S-box protein, partial [Acidobacteriota bacterium]